MQVMPSLPVLGEAPEQVEEAAAQVGRIEVEAGFGHQVDQVLGSRPRRRGSQSVSVAS